MSFIIGMATMGFCIAGWSALLHTSNGVSSSSPNRALPDVAEGLDDRGLPASWFGGECGSTPEEAKSRSCVYSFVIHAWLPERCLDEDDRKDDELMYKNKSWTFDEDNNGTAILLDELRRGELESFYTSNDWHVTHCMYVWKRGHRAMLNPEKEVDAYTASLHHTEHCAKMISGEMDHDEESEERDWTRVWAKYPKCSKTK